MIPKKSTLLYKDVSEDLNITIDLVEDFIEYYYKEIRKNLTGLTYPRINIDGLGHFVAKTGIIRKAIPRYTKALESHDTSTFSAYFNKKGIETKLDALLTLELKLIELDVKKQEFKKTKNEKYTKGDMGQ